MIAQEREEEADPSEEGIVAAWKAFAAHADGRSGDHPCPPCERLAHAMRLRPGKPARDAVEGCCEEGFGLAMRWIRCCEARLGLLRTVRRSR